MPITFQMYVHSDGERRFASKQVSRMFVPRAGDYVQCAEEWPDQEVSNATLMLDGSVIVWLNDLHLTTPEDVAAFAPDFLAARWEIEPA